MSSQQTRTVKPGIIARRLPVVSWLSHYQREWFAADVVAGVSVWALLVPQSVAYASIVGVPAQYGLYTAMFAVLGYALFGTSKQLVTGPSATVAALSASVVGAIAFAGTAQSPTWVTYSAALAVIAGVLYVLLGVLGMGWISNFLSKAVLGGFVFGFGVGLTIDQSHKILGVPKVDGSYWQILVGTIKELPQTNPVTLAIGASAIVLLLLMRRFAPRWPRALLVVALGIAVSGALSVSANYGVKIVGTVPTGMPTFAVPAIDPSALGLLITGAVAVILVGFSESLAAASETAAKHGDEIDASQEMIAQGAATAAAGLFGGFVVDGSLSKTTVADLAGQKTQLASFVTSGLVLLTVLFLAALFTNLPQAVLGAVVIDAAIGLIKVKEFKRFMQTSRTDFAAYIAAMLGLLFIGVLAGILIGVAISLLMLIAAASHSPVRRMGLDEQQDAYVSIETHPDATVTPGLLVVEIAGALFFADVANFRTSIQDMVRDDAPSVVVIDLGPTPRIDLDGADMLTRLKQELSATHVDMTLARVGARHRAILERAGTIEAVGEDHVFETVRAAVAAVRAQQGS